MDQSMEVTVLAKGAPVRTSSGDISMCAIAVGPIGLVRLYPLTVTEHKEIKVWSRIAITARRSNKDYRKESWRITSCKLVGSLEHPQAKADLLDSCLLKSGITDPIKYQNEHKASIAVVKSSEYLGGGLLAREEDDFTDFDEDESWVMTQSNYPFKPYLFWKSIQGGKHQTHLLAQEVYVGMKNLSATPFRVFENMHIGDADYDHWMILGNMKDRPNVWVCPHLHRLKKTSFITSLSLPMIDGESEGWPYCKQEDRNAKDVGPQMLLPFITDDMN